jgi:uncharacterized protein (DUF488 family)
MTESTTKQTVNLLTVFTVGHSNHTLESFIEILKAHGITELIDIRTVPRSRHNPQFNRESLPLSLKEVGIQYRHAAELGGLRHPREDSPNTGWHNASFRGFADYMQTAKFEESVQMLIQQAQGERVALMCAEAVPWNCHRSLIADALMVRGIQVEHITSKTHRQPHRFTQWAKTDGTKIIYH